MRSSNFVNFKQANKRQKVNYIVWGKMQKFFSKCNAGIKISKVKITVHSSNNSTVPMSKPCNFEISKVLVYSTTKIRTHFCFIDRFRDVFPANPRLFSSFGQDIFVSYI